MSDEDDLLPPCVARGHCHTGLITSTISVQMRCKVFLKQQHQQRRNLAAAKLKLYHQNPTNVKQLVVEADTKEKTTTIVLSDGVECVGKTGIAIELTDQGVRTRILYMIQVRNETSVGGLFDSLLAGSVWTIAVPMTVLRTDLEQGGVVMKDLPKYTTPLWNQLHTEFETPLMYAMLEIVVFQSRI